MTGAHHYKIHWDNLDADWSRWETALRYYYARMTMIDAQIGRLLDWLEENNLLESTLIVFSSDHGDAIGSHGGLWDKGFNHFEEIQRIPMIARLPKGECAGTIRNELVSLTDIYPTFLDAANAPPPSYATHGQSLLPLIQENTDNWRDSVVCEFLGLGNISMSLKTLRWGDNGLAVGQHGLMGKQSLYDHSVRVPLLMAGPGIEPPASATGQSFLHRENIHDDLYLAHSHTQRALRTKTHKLIKTTVDRQLITQLFDLESDPWETNNLASDPAHFPLLQSLREKMNTAAKSSGDTSRQ